MLPNLFRAPLASRGAARVIASAVPAALLAASLGVPTAVASGGQSHAPSPHVALSLSSSRSEIARSAMAGAVDSSDRAEVIDAYITRWLPALATPFSWTGGDVASCRPGTPASTVVDATLAAVNYLRAQAGVSPVTEDPARSALAQSAALLMEANNQLSHYPPSSWQCWSADGAEGARRSNLALGVTGVEATSLFMSDPGANNTAAGHRGWILDPQVHGVGFGLTPRAHAMHVVGPDYGDPFGDGRAEPVTWPTAGYFPEGLLPASGRWSFDTYRSASVDRVVSNAQVHVDRVASDGALSALPVSIDSRSESRVVFVPAGVQPASAVGGDVTYRVELSGLTHVDGTPAGDVVYTVTVVDADPDPDPDPVLVEYPTVTGTTRVGEVLTASPGLWRHATSYRFQWLRETVPIPGATSSQYVPTVADLTRRLRVRVVALNAGGASTTAQSSTTTTVAYGYAPVAAGPVTLSGTAVVGRRLTVQVPVFTPMPAAVKVTWLRDGRPIRGSTATTYRLRAADRRALVAVRVRTATAGYLSTTEESAPVRVRRR